MANSSAKRTAKDNAATLQRLQWGFLLTHAVYWAYRIGIHYNTFTTALMVAYAINTVLSGYLFRQLYAMGVGRVDPKTGVMVSAGADLSAPGLTQYMFDIIYVSWFVLWTTALVSDTMWWFYLVVPGYAFYKVWTKFLWPYLSSRSSSSADGSSHSGKSKRQEKRENRQQQPKYQFAKH